MAKKKPNKQQRYAQRRTELGMCTICTEPAELNARDPSKFSPYCKGHKIANRERARARIGAKRRWKNASSYEA
jgi:hypothetical protein